MQMQFGGEEDKEAILFFNTISPTLFITFRMQMKAGIYF